MATESDHPDVMVALATWWGDAGDATGGAQRAALLPRLFFQHFANTSLVVHDGARLVAFIVGFLSQSRPDEAYIHFVGVAPDCQGQGLGTHLYEWFFSTARTHGRSMVRAITSVPNTGSQAFHRRMGFSVSDPIAGYDGRGGDRVAFARAL
jgi:ribosomal protein S18 acetylase RimI-like enzyme